METSHGTSLCCLCIGIQLVYDVFKYAFHTGLLLNLVLLNLAVEKFQICLLFYLLEVSNIIWRVILVLAGLRWANRLALFIQTEKSTLSCYFLLYSYLLKPTVCPDFWLARFEDIILGPDFMSHSFTILKENKRNYLWAYPSRFAQSMQHGAKPTKSLIVFTRLPNVYSTGWL